MTNPVSGPVQLDCHKDLSGGCVYGLNLLHDEGFVTLYKHYMKLVTKTPGLGVLNFVHVPLSGYAFFRVSNSRRSLQRCLSSLGVSLTQ